MSESNHTFSSGDKTLNTVPNVFFILAYYFLRTCVMKKMANNISKAANRALDLEIVKS